MEENNKKSKDSQESNNNSGSTPPLDLKLKNSNQNSASEELIIDNGQKVEPKEATQSSDNNGASNINANVSQNNTNNYQTGMPSQPNNNFNNGNLPPAPAKSHTGLIIGIIVGVLVLFVLIAGMIILLLAFSRSKNKVVTNNGPSNKSSISSDNNTNLDTSASDYNTDYYYSFKADTNYYGPDWRVEGSTSDPGTREFYNAKTGCVAIFKSTANDQKVSTNRAIEDSIAAIRNSPSNSDVVIEDENSGDVSLSKIDGGRVYLKSYEISLKQNGLPAKARISAYATSKSVLFGSEVCLAENWYAGQSEFYKIEDKQEILGY